MTRHELDELLAKSKAAKNRRDWILRIAFYGLMALGSLPMAYHGFLGGLPKAAVIAYLVSLLTAFLALGGFVLFTSRSFHNRVTPRCPRCGAGIEWVREALLIEALGGYAKPEDITCKSCKETIVRVWPSPGKG